MTRPSHLIAVLWVSALCAMTPLAFAGEQVVLTNGSRLHADGHEVSGVFVKLFVGSGQTYIPAASVAGFEPEEETKPAPTEPAVTATPAGGGAKTSAATPAELAGAAAKKYRLPDAFVRSVMKAESGYRADAVSPKGAIGLMQLMPDTARQLGVDPKDPGQNAEGGAQYLRELLEKYENDPDQVLLALAAYNAGPKAVEKYHGVPPYPETREYILRVLRNWKVDTK
jgi:pyruvate/2-oxoglutarate dehydrogenase complex dihydrolipoamide acyltransferase (E2) component